MCLRRLSLTARLADASDRKDSVPRPSTTCRPPPRRRCGKRRSSSTCSTTSKMGVVGAVAMAGRRTGHYLCRVYIECNWRQRFSSNRPIPDIEGFPLVPLVMSGAALVRSQNVPTAGCIKARLPPSQNFWGSLPLSDLPSENSPRKVTCAQHSRRWTSSTWRALRRATTSCKHPLPRPRRWSR